MGQIANETGPDFDPEVYQLLDELAAEFAERFRRGERPSLKEYADRFPELAAEIQELFPAMVQIEQAEEVRADRGSAAIPHAAPPRQVGDFRILREIGRGGMGIVYEAEQVALGRHVALKVLPRASMKDGRALARFRHEARAAARLHHTNIVPVFEVGQDGDVVFYAMQFIQGQGLDLVVEELKSLRQRTQATSGGPAKPISLRVRNDTANGVHEPGETIPAQRPQSLMTHALLSGQLRFDVPSHVVVAEADATTPDRWISETGSSESSPANSSSAVLPGGAPISAVEPLGRRMPYFRSVAQLGRQAAEGLAHAHGRGIIHRDIKPSNLLLDTAGILWITDFGLAKTGGDRADLTATGDLLGTLRYMAPERFRGAGDSLSDIYALGLTLYELLTLRPAFDSTDRLALIEQVRSQEPPRPRLLDARIPRDLETIVLKAMEKEPRRRYASASELSEDLRRFLDGEPIKARRVGDLERAWKWARRRPTLTGLMLLAIASLLGGTAASTIFALRANHYAAVAHSKAGVAILAEAKSHRVALDSRRVAADSRLASALAAADSGEVDRGVYGMIEALDLAPDISPEDQARRSAIRRGLSAWMATLPIPRLAIDGIADVDFVTFTGSHHTVLNVISGKRVRRFDLLTGAPTAEHADEVYPDTIHNLTPDGRMVLTIAAGPKGPKPSWTVRVLETGTKSLRVELNVLGLTRLDRPILFDPNGRFIGITENPYTVENKDGLRRCLIFRLDTGVTAGPPNPALEDWQRPETRFIAVKGGRSVLACVRQLPGDVKSVTTSLLFWDLEHQRFIDRIEPEESIGPMGAPDQRVYHGFDGTHLVTVFDHGLVRWRDPATGKLARPDWRPLRARRSAILVDDCRSMLVRCDDSRVRCYDLAAGHEGSAAPRLIGWRSAKPGDANETVILQGSFLLARRGASLIVSQLVDPMHAPLVERQRPENMLYAAVDFAPGDDEYMVGSARANGSSMGLDFSLRDDSGLDVTYGWKAAARLDAATGRPIGASPYPANCHPCYSPDGRLVAACRTQTMKRHAFQSAYVCVWDRTTGETVLPWTEMPQFIHSLAFTPDSRTLAVGCVAGAWLLDVGGKQTPRFLIQPGPITRMIFSPDGRRLALGSRNGWEGTTPGVRLWDVSTGAPAGPHFKTAQLPFFRFAPDGRTLLLLDISNRRIAQLDAETGEPRPTIVHLSDPTAHPDDQWHSLGKPFSLAYEFSTLGNLLAESSTTGVVRQYGVESGRAVGAPMHHSAPVSWLAYSPDGQTLASACTDGSVRLWDPSTGLPLGPSLSLGRVPLAVRFVASGDELLAIGVDGHSARMRVPRLAPSG